MFEPVEYDIDIGEVGRTLIKVIGVGGGGGNAVNHMVACLQNGDAVLSDEGSYMSNEHGEIIYYAVNTDAQALRKSLVQQTVQIGATTTKGLGAGANPNVGKKAAEDDHEAIRAMLEGADMVFIAAGMGGGTGTGAAPVIAQIAKELGILTVAVVTKPFAFEMKKRMALAEMGIKELSKYVDSIIVIPNEKLLKVLGGKMTLANAFSTVNDVLRNSVTGISDMITSPGLINVDFADVKTVMSEMGRAMMGTGIAQGSPGDDRAEKAARGAIASPLLEDVDLKGAKGVLVNVISGMDLTLEEFYQVGQTIEEFASDDATVVVGTTLVPDMVDELRVTVVATGLGDNEQVSPLTQVRPETLTNTGTNPQNSGQTTQEEQTNRPTSLGGRIFDPTRRPF